jgi:heme/copper-type cytochrome/quinol oxidase subunit 2
MTPSLASLVLAHAGEVGVGKSGELAYTIILVTVLTVVWGIVGVVCWIFWRAKKREEAAIAEKRSAWSNARSS